MRKLSLPGARAYPTIHAQSQRFAQAWSDSQALQIETSGRSLFSIWSDLGAEQRSRYVRALLCLAQLYSSESLTPMYRPVLIHRNY